MIPKNKPIREPLYTKWVGTLPSCLSQRPGMVAHHAIGLGNGAMGSKESDLYCMPVDQADHDRFHKDPSLKYDQLRFALETIEEAFRQGVIVFDKAQLKKLSKREY